MLAQPRANIVETRRTRRWTSSQERFLIGGSAALLATLVNWLQVDIQVLKGPDALLTMAVAVAKLPVFFLVGGFWAWIHSDEKKPLKIAELGILAPAVILGLLTGAAIKSQNAQQNGTSAPVVQPHGWVFDLPRAYAEPLLQSETPKRFSLPDETTSSQVWRGLTGQVQTRVYFVIVSQHDKLPEAQAAAKKLDEQELSALPFKAEVYEPSGGYPSYAAVIGANLTLREAESLRDQAIAAGVVPREVWKLGE